MTVETKFFSLNQDLSPQEWINILSVLINTKAAQNNTTDIQTTFLDTFDWSFYGKSISLVVEESDQAVLKWIEAERTFSQPINQIPKLASDLDPSKLAERIDRVLGLRALLPVVRVKSVQTPLLILDENNQTHVRLTLEEISQKTTSSARRNQKIDLRLRVDCLAGYESEFALCLEKLKTLNGVQASADLSLLNAALHNLGRAPLDYSSKLKLELDRDMRADEALKHILMDQLDKIERNLDGTRKNIDSEFLHDLRVAVRRSRSALSRLKGVFPETVQTKFSEELAWVGAITTPVRDLDVYMIDFPKYRDQLRPDLQADMTPLYDFLLSQYDGARSQLLDDLNSRRFKEFVSKWKAYLKKPLPARPSAPAAGFDIGELADQRIWKTYRRVINEGRVITDESPAEALHDLRKTCKKLRYLLEFFASLYEKDKIAHLIKELKGLQENLGDFQDLDVQADTLHDYSTKMMTQGQSNPKVYMAMGVLVEQFMIRKAHVRDEFATRFQRFASKNIKRDFKNLTHPEKKVTIALSDLVDQTGS